MFLLRYGSPAGSKTRILLILSAVFYVIAAPARASGDHHGHGHDHDHGHHAEHADESARGPQGGRLLEHDDFAIELVISKEGASSGFRAYAYDHGKAVDPSQVQLQIELQRLGDDKEIFQFAPAGDYLQGGGAVGEPHSFDVRVSARYKGEPYQWEFESRDGRTRISAEAARAAGVQTGIAGPARIRQTVMLYGTVRPDEERVWRVTAPYAGHVREVKVSVGDRVRRGDALALMQNKESLAPYSVKAPHDGMIVSRHANPGELTHDDEAMFILADLSQVWIDFAAFPGQYSALKAGQTVEVRGHGHDHIDRATIRYIAPVGSSASQSILVRAVLDNSEGHWIPGLLVTGDVVIADDEVPLAVRTSALQSFRDSTIVFARFGESYEVRMPEFGRRDNEYVEILGGLKPGVEYVTGNSYLIKADILKSGAAHDH